MRRLFIISVILLTLCAFAPAQYPGEEPTWAAFQHPKAEFSVEFPGRNVSEAFNIPGPEPSSLYKMSYEKFYFFMFIENNEEVSAYDEIKAYAAANDASTKEVEIDGLAGARYDFNSDDGYAHSFITIQGKTFFYLFHVAGESRDEKMFEKFLGSIKLIEPAQKVKEKEGGAPNSKAVSSILKEAPVAPQFPDSGGPGILSGTSTIAPPKYTKITAGVSITAKPRPAYTDLARRYSISGTVRLRVSFQKDGQIGEVKPVAKLPFGLLGSAMRAARQIKFVPAQREGEPYTETKNVEYNFTLY